MKTVGFTGESGGRVKGLCELCVCIPSRSTQRIQETHILVGHMICEILEEALG